MTIPYFDAHCDTALELYRGKKSLRENEQHLDLKRLSVFSPCGQVFAVCVPHSTEMVSETEAVLRFFAETALENREWISVCRSAQELRAALHSGRIAALLSVEGADRLGASPDGLKRFYDLGVRVVHLTWNEDNALCGAALDSGAGLTRSGREFVAQAQSMGVAIDLSHCSERGFWDVMECAEKPVLAGHSNSKLLCPHPRNLTDAQFSALVKTGGLAGLNFYAEFLGLTKDMDAILAHAEHWLSLGGEKSVCLGTDFDGMDVLPAGVTGVESMGALYEAMLRKNWTETLVKDIFFNNLNTFFGRVL